jgi:aspartate aminotransferase
MVTAKQTAFAARALAVSESKTTRVFTLARQLQQQGRGIISLAVGEPDFDTPTEVISATSQALEDQATRYGPVAGLEALRAALAEAFGGYGPEGIVISNGAKQALFTLFQVLCDPGDEIIVPAPYWVSFTEQIKLAGGRPVPVATVEHQIDPGAIEAAITQRTKAILVNTPNNPTGAVYAQDALARLVAMAEKHGIYIISDEAYHVFTYDGLPRVGVWAASGRSDRVITVRSFSKHYNMTGFRLGYMAAHPALIQSMVKLQSHISGNVCTFAQHGALAALGMDPSVVEQRKQQLERRRDFAFDAVRALFDCVRPQGAFYLFPDVTRHLKKNETSEDLAMRLLEKAGVAVVPGEAFGGPGHIRISFGAKEEDLQMAFERIRKAL